MANVNDDVNQIEQELAVEDTAAVDPSLAQKYEKSDAELQAEVDQEIALEEQFGASPVTAFTEGAARGFTAGLSDVAANQIGADTSAIAERQQRNPLASTVGEVAGTVASVLTPVGPVAQVAKAGRAVEKAAELALKQTLKGTGRAQFAKTVAKSIAPKLASGALEGGTLAVGQLLSEDALGKTDLNAENLMATFGAGAVLGGALNTSIAGAAKAIPALSKGVKRVTGNVFTKAAKSLDPETAAQNFVGLTPRDVVKLQKRDPTILQDLPKFLRDEMKLSITDTAEDVAMKNSKLLRDSAKKIEESVAVLDDFSVRNNQFMPTRTQVADDLLKITKKAKEELMLTPEVSKAELRALLAFEKEAQAYGIRSGNVNFSELNELRKAYAKKAKFNPMGAPADNFRAKIANEFRAELRGQLNEIAKLTKGSNEVAAKTAAEELLTNNRRFHIAEMLDEKLSTKAAREGQGLGLKDLVQAGVFTSVGGIAGAAGSIISSAVGAQDILRKTVILTDLKRINDAVNSKLKGSVNSFLKGAKKGPKIESPRILVNSFLARRDDKQPKNRREALQNVRANLQDMQADPEQTINKLAKSSAVLQDAAPQTAQILNERIANAVRFLGERMPRNSTDTTSIFTKRPYQPSDNELAKLERYMQVIEAPTTVFDDIERGTLTREHVEALKAVYPSIYHSIQTEVLQNVMESQDSMPYSRRLQLGLLLDIPTDESLMPQNILGLQESFMMQQTPPEPRTSAITSSEKANRMESGSESIANRKK